jgi:hypothetical protein
MASAGRSFGVSLIGTWFSAAPTDVLYMIIVIFKAKKN